MSTLAFKPLASSITFSTDSMTISLHDGRTLAVPLIYFPKLLAATPEQRRNVVISGGGIGLHWDELDEDISMHHLMMGYVNNYTDKRIAA